MSGTKKGGLLAAQTNKFKYGEDFYWRVGKLGGAAGNTGGFWYAKHVKKDVEFIKEAGRRGGQISRKSYANQKSSV